ncbi:MAG: pseudouridine synthase [Bacteroidales bacterium]
MREKKNFGKKPVRRSRPEEKETPRTYKPRTLKSKGREKTNTEKNASDDAFSSNDNFSQPQQERSPKRTRSSSRESFKERRSDSRGKREDNARKYKPRTLRDRAEGSERPLRRESFGKEDKIEKNEGKSPSYYEKKFSKPKIEKRPKEKPLEDKIEKEPKIKPTPPEIENELKTDNEGFIRLNKYISNSGLCSRREADSLIEKGLITVNGEVVEELGVKVKLTDEIRYKEKHLDPEKKVYILLNKPKDYITTVDDPNATRTVMELIEDACDQRVYPVGRLDRNSTGLLLFTNDGEMTKRLTHPSFMKKKVYEVGLDKKVSPEDMETIRNGIEIEGETIKADAIEYVDNDDLSKIGIEIHSGQNRIVRRIFEKLGYRVYKLDRVYFAGLTKKNLPRGKWRFLTQKEVNMLRMNRFE